MNYEAWRITFQDSEQAAKAAFEESQRWERLFAMAFGSVVELTEAAGIRKEDQLMGGTIQALNAIEKLKERREKWKARALKAEQWNREMVAKAAEKSLDGYRELGRKAAAAEEERDALAAHANQLCRSIHQWHEGYVSDEDMMRILFEWERNSYDLQPVGIKPATMPSQGTPGTCTLLGGDHASD